jgi:hypothetical protein
LDQLFLALAKASGACRGSHQSLGSQIHHSMAGGKGKAGPAAAQRKFTRLPTRNAGQSPSLTGGQVAAAWQTVVLLWRLPAFDVLYVNKGYI